MSNPPKSASVAQKTLTASPKKRVLLVEGKNDKSVYERWLQKLAHPHLFTDKVIVEDVEGKRAVLGALAWFRDYGGDPKQLFALVDRDEWDDAFIAKQTSDLSQLRVVSGRDGLESYFTDPDELEASILAEIPASAAQMPTFRQHLQTALPLWVAHWALFTTTERVKERMNAAMYPGAFNAEIPIPPDANIQNRFQEWANIVSHPQLFQEFAGLRGRALGAPEAVQFRSHVSAKKFFEELVHSEPDGLQRFRKKSGASWRVDLAENAPTVPADVAPILQELLA